jgi:hypothetical protein
MGIRLSSPLTAQRQVWGAILGGARAVLHETRRHVGGLRRGGSREVQPSSCRCRIERHDELAALSG